MCGYIMDFLKQAFIREWRCFFDFFPSLLLFWSDRGSIICSFHFSLFPNIYSFFAESQAGLWMGWGREVPEVHARRYLLPSTDCAFVWCSNTVPQMLLLPFLSPNSAEGIPLSALHSEHRTQSENHTITGLRSQVTEFGGIRVAGN